MLYNVVLVSAIQQCESAAFEECPAIHSLVSLVAQVVKSLPAMQETMVQSLGQEDPLEKEMATHSSILAWKNPINGGAWCATVHRDARVGHD